MFSDLLTSGWYWIDPNLGTPDDAIHAYCDLRASGQTCVFPDEASAKTPLRSWKAPQGLNPVTSDVAFSQMEDGFQVLIICDHFYCRRRRLWLSAQLTTNGAYKYNNSTSLLIFI